MLMKKENRLVKLVLCTYLFLIFSTLTQSQTTNLGSTYIESWKQFYPSKALTQGMQTAIFDYEDLTIDNIEKWIAINKKVKVELKRRNSIYTKENPIDARLLNLQIQEEINKWEVKKIHEHSLSLYADLITKAVDEVLKANYLTPKEKSRLICQRLTAVQKLCRAAKRHLKSEETNDLEIGIKKLKTVLPFYVQHLPKQVSHLPKAYHCLEFDDVGTTAKSIQSLIDYMETYYLPKPIVANPILGRVEYARRLALYTDSDLTPKQLEAMALEEIETVRELIANVSLDYLKQTYPNQSFPNKGDAIKAAFVDMEKDAPKDGADYLQFWLELKAAAIKFIAENDIATLPEFQTLRIIPAPESAGPAARIGWVDSAPPFASNPVTTLYLPSIPDTLPAQEQKDFWASFNKPFNRMIVIHELFPGHYMQIKISRETPHPVRLLFPYKPYFEGWATFTERVLLDAGWEKERPLTFLAHLRKRIENANRAYTSIQVHCNNWTAEQVMAFSTEKSLLAPQFAKSLWGRIMRSPLQLTSYFQGGQQFTDLLAAEKSRLGDRFVLKDFMDTIMRIGPIPIDEFPAIFETSKP